MMAKKFSDLRAVMSQAARDRSDAKAKVMLAEIPLNELRQECDLPQKMLGDVPRVNQSSIAKIEKRMRT
jgi:DNA-binding XRE family transcriptional regulator